MSKGKPLQPSNRYTSNGRTPEAGWTVEDAKGSVAVFDDEVYVEARKEVKLSSCSVTVSFRH